MPRGTCDDKLVARLIGDLLERLDQHVALLLRNETRQIQNVFSRGHTELQNFVGCPLRAFLYAIWDVDNLSPVLGVKRPLQLLTNDYRLVRKLDGRSLPDAQKPAAEYAPFAALPVESMHGDDNFLAKNFCQGPHWSRAATVAVDDIGRPENVSQRREQGPDDSIEVLGWNAVDVAQLYSAVGRLPVLAPTGAVHGDIQAQCHQPRRHGFDDALHAAPMAGYSATPDLGDPDGFLHNSRRKGTTASDPGSPTSGSKLAQFRGAPSIRKTAA